MCNDFRLNSISALNSKGSVTICFSNPDNPTDWIEEVFHLDDLSIEKIMQALEIKNKNQVTYEIIQFAADTLKREKKSSRAYNYLVLNRDKFT